MPQTQAEETMEGATLPPMNVRMNQSGPGVPRVEHFKGLPGQRRLVSTRRTPSSIGKHSATLGEFRPGLRTVISGM